MNLGSVKDHDIDALECIRYLMTYASNAGKSVEIFTPADVSELLTTWNSWKENN